MILLTGQTIPGHQEEHLKTPNPLEPFINRSYVAVWYWIQEFDPKEVYPNKKKKSRISASIIDETLIQIASTDACPLVAIEPIHNRILGVSISRHRNMLVAESFLGSLIKLYGKHIVYSNGMGTYLILCPNSFDKISAACFPVTSSDAISILFPKGSRRSSTRAENSAIFSRALCCKVVVKIKVKPTDPALILDQAGFP